MIEYKVIELFLMYTTIITMIFALIQNRNN